MTYQWDNKKPTAQMLGRWQPFHDGHYTLFKEIIKKTGQVCIQIRDVQGVEVFDVSSIVFFTSFAIEGVSCEDNKARIIEVKKKQPPRNAVNFVIKFAVPLAVIKPPPAPDPPMPNPPPSLFCINTTNIMHIAKITCIDIVIWIFFPEFLKFI